LQVVAAVEAEIQNSLSDYEVSDEDYVAVSRAAWSREATYLLVTFLHSSM
jgi:hypothetical protein